VLKPASFTHTYAQNKLKYAQNKINTCINQALIAEEKALGRIRKETVGQIKVLSSQGFTGTEIAEKIGVCRNTVSKYAPGTPGKGCTPELEILFEAFFGLLVDLNTSAFIEQENMAGLSDDRALQVIKKIFGVNQALAKRIVTPYVDHLKLVNILNLAVPDVELPDGDVRLRRQWTVLLKKQYPEKLAELV